MTHTQVLALSAVAKSRLIPASDQDNLFYYIPSGAPGSAAVPMNTMTAASLIEKLIDSTLTPAAVAIRDLTDWAAPDGVIAWKGPYLARHDSNKPGGNIIGRSVSGVFLHSLQSQPKAGAFQRVVAIPLFPDETQVGVRVALSGRVVITPLSTGPLTNITAGFAFDGGSVQNDDGEHGWHSVSLHPNPGTNADFLSAEFSPAILADFYELDTNILGLEFGVSKARASHDLVISGQPVRKPGVYTDFVTHYTEFTNANEAANIWLMVQVSVVGGGNFVAGQNLLITYDLHTAITEA